MNDFIWFPMKENKFTRSNVFQNLKEQKFKIPLSRIYIGSKQFKIVDNKELKINFDGFEFEIYNSESTGSENIKISKTQIQEVQYSNKIDLLMIIIKSDLDSKYLLNNTAESDTFKNFIWFCLNTGNYEENKDVINNLTSFLTVKQMTRILYNNFNKLYQLNDKKVNTVSEASTLNDDKMSINNINNEILEFSTEVNNVFDIKDYKVLSPNNLKLEKKQSLNCEKIKLCPINDDLNMFTEIKLLDDNANVQLCSLLKTKKVLIPNNLKSEKKQSHNYEKIKLCPTIDDFNMLAQIKLLNNNVNVEVCSPLKSIKETKKMRLLKRSGTNPTSNVEKRSKIVLRSSRKLLYSPSSTQSIEITEVDLQCLHPGKYLNDNIINLYLTHIYFETLNSAQRESTYFFNVFFNTKLIGTTAQQKIDTPATRHARVAKWTKNVDLFSKDFLVMPVIEDEHWFLVIVCFPWMSGMINYQKLFKTNNKTDIIPLNTSNFALNTRVTKFLELKMKNGVDAMPCILIFDSLDLQNRGNKVNIIRDYLKSEWDVRRKSNDGPLIFDKTTCRGYCPIVLKQNNGTDCGLYLLQYVESFFTNPLLSYDREVFRRGFVNWFERSIVDNKRLEMKRLILSKTSEITQVEDEDDEDSVNCVNIL